jgi:uncharacterized protein (DUF849 family)
MIPTRDQCPTVPISPAEIIEQTHEAWEIGITIAHLHARDEAGTPSWKPEIYRDIFEGVRRHCPGLIICGSTSGRNFTEFEKRSAVIELRPDMCSLTLSSLNFHGHESVNAPAMITRLAEKMNEYGVKPELECFHLGMTNFGKYLIQKGVLKPPFYWNFIFGNIAGLQASLSHMGTAVSDLHGEDHYIAFGGIGQHQLEANAIAIVAGYGVRVGLEDNTWFDAKRTRVASNRMLLERVHELATIHQRPLFTSEAFAKIGFSNSTAYVPAGI